MKEFFRFPADFLQNFFRSRRRERAQSCKGHRHIHPKIPKRTQNRAAQAEIKHRAEKAAQQQIQPQLPIRRAQRIADQSRRHAQAKQDVAQRQHPREPPPHRAEKIVGQSQNHAQKRRAAKQEQLLGNIVLHPRLPEQPREKAAALASVVLILQCVDLPLHMQLAAVQIELPDM